MAEKQKTVSIDEFEQITRSAENDYSKTLLVHFKKVLIVLAIFCIYMFIPKTLFIIPTGHTNEKLDVSKDPVMIISESNLKAGSLSKSSDYDKFIKYKSFKNRKTYYLLPVAKYSITAKVLQKNTFFYMKWDFDNVSLADYGFSWGDMASKEYFNKIKSSSNQSVLGRMLVFGFKDKSLYATKRDYLRSHTSHTHTIPASKKLKRVLYSFKKGQIVKLDGYLVDIYDSGYNRFAMSSLSLNDTDDSARGGGACEVMYVTKVQIGDKIYE